MTPRSISLFICTTLLLIIGCSPKPDNQIVPINLLFSDREISCKLPIKIQQQSWNIDQLQFYLSEFEGQKADGTWQTLQLVDNTFQTADVALIGEHCRGEDEQRNWQLIFSETIDTKKYNAFRFNIGVPFSLNHANPISQPSPLNEPSMFWVWQTGHKFVRLELSHLSHPWVFHLGSTGCKSASVMRAPNQECKYSHRYQIQLPLSGIDISLSLDLAPLLTNVLLSNSSGCQSDRTDKNCEAIFNNLEQLNKNKLFSLGKVNE